MCKAPLALSRSVVMTCTASCPGCLEVQQETLGCSCAVLPRNLAWAPHCAPCLETMTWHTPSTGGMHGRDAAMHAARGYKPEAMVTTPILRIRIAQP